jgi:hypothetical protein
MPREQRTARLTVLIDPDKKAVFERLCALDDVTSSQVIRRLIREFIEQRTGRPWQPGERPEHLPAKLPNPMPRADGKRAKTR